MEEGLTPLLNSPLVSVSLKGRGEEILERGFAPLLPILPLNKYYHARKGEITTVVKGV